MIAPERPVIGRKPGFGPVTVQEDVDRDPVGLDFAAALNDKRDQNKGYATALYDRT